MAIAGASCDAPPLLARQSVVAGVSDGAVRVFERDDAPVPLQLPEAAALPPGFLADLARMPIRHAAV